MNKSVKKTKKTKKNQTTFTGNGYTAKDIYILEGLEPVRKTPGMYIGSTGPEGLHHLIWECVDNSIDEAMAGFAKNIKVEILKENKVAVTDDGRGIPVDIHAKTKKSALETVLCTLHAGGKFGGKSYKVAGGLHGVGVSVVNALSQYLRAEICRDGTLYSQEYNRGKPKTKLKKLGKCKKTGTKIVFEPDSEIFKEIKFDTKKILDHLRQQAYLTPGITIKFEDYRENARPSSYAFHFESGIIALVQYLAKDCHGLTDNVFYVKQEKDDILVEVALFYTDDTESTELAFANNIHTPEGGMHLTGFRSALTRTLNDYAKEQGIFKNGEDGFTGEDTREGLVSVISVKLRKPQFEGQTKAKLGNPEVRTVVEQVVGEGFKEFLGIHKEDAKRIIEKSLLTARARQAAKKARENILRKGVFEGSSLPGKLADCISRHPEDSELFIVEGESAGGSGKMGRDRNTQAILPLRGKILNVEKSRLDKIMSSEEIKNLIIALGTAISEDFNINKLRYHKIILMADADSVTGDTPIFVFNKQNQNFFLTTIEEFVQSCENTKNYKILVYNSKSKTRQLQEIFETIRHPLRTPLYEIKTYCGYPIKVTACHSVYVYDDGEIITKKGSDIKQGDYLIFPKKLPENEQEINIDLSEIIFDSKKDNISIKLNKKDLKVVPGNAWCELGIESFRKFKQRRELIGISRRKMETLIGVGVGVIQQWEGRFDNVMPRFGKFQKYANQLQINSQNLDYYIYVPLAEWPERETPKDIEFYLENHTRNIRTKFKLDEDLAFLIGFFLGDGCYVFEKNSPNRFVISLNKDKAKNYIEKLSRIIKEEFNAKPIIDFRKPNSLSLYFHSFEFKMLLAYLGILGKRANEKFIPDILFNTKREIQEALLEGLLGSDGFITVWSKKKARKAIYGWRLSSQKLIYGILTILRQWGIFPAYGEYQNKAHLRKDGKLIKSNFPSFDLSISTVEYFKKTENIWKFHKDADKLREYLKQVNYKKITGKDLKEISSDFICLKVKKTKEIKNPKDKWVYDFSILKDENFIAGPAGVLLHNTDGAHIRTLLLTLFFRYFKPIIEAGYLYIAHPPLYRIQKGKEISYAYTESEKQKVLEKIQEKELDKKSEKPSKSKVRKLKLVSEGKEEAVFEVKTEEDQTPIEGGESLKGINIQRYKGLGEMNPNQLWETTMDPQKRILKRVTIEDAEAADRLFDILMGEEVLPRKKFIEAYAKKVKNLDI